MVKSSKIIVLRLIGGLGNQLFIYAFAEAIAIRYNYRIIFDLTTGFRKDNFGRSPKLPNYVSKIAKASPKLIYLFYLTKISPVLSKFIFNSKYILEQNPQFLLDVEKDLIDSRIVFLQGYFQSYVYFIEYEEQIKANIILDFKKSQKVKKIASEILLGNAVSIHVRRVQYSNLLDIDYYLNAISYMNESLNEPKYFVFSDDIEWCKNNIKSDKELIFVVHDVEDEVADLWLMSKCKNHIIANSSFSWWGAWLGENTKKIVIAPKNNQIGVPNKFYPSDWVLI